MPLADEGFLHGDGVFETIRVHRGAPFRFDRHLRRLDESLQALDLPFPCARDDLRRGARAVVDESHVAQGLVRITITGPNRDAGLAGTAAVTFRPLPETPGRVALRIVDSIRRMPGPLSRCKTTSRAAEAMALREARRAGAFDAVLMNPAGRIVETTSRNLFLVSGGGLRTPPLSEGALAGVTREAVLELAPVLGVRPEEVPVAVEDLPSAEEVFLTGSGVGILGVTEVGGFRAKSSPGPVTARLTAAYRTLLDRESMW